MCVLSQKQPTLKQTSETGDETESCNTSTQY